MKAVSLLHPPAPPPPTETSEALQARILTLLEPLGEADDIALWQASKPRYFPWQLYWQALRTLAAAGQLHLEMRAPGDWLVRSCTFARQAKPLAPKARRPATKPSAKATTKSVAKRKTPAPAAGRRRAA